MEPIRAEILRRQVETGETSVEHDGWISTLTKEKVSAALIERQYCYPKDELPGDICVETMELKLSEELVLRWLKEKGPRFQAKRHPFRQEEPPRGQK
ncbi:hypothetical protein [Mesorhizobium sp. M0408]|uniref:hypothetical protein n=1 Tax=Mesorhizobium sp. M0408 TaxID=2956942 RepID=UPI003338F95C